MPDGIIIAAGSVLMALGLAGVLVPGIPGLGLIWVVALGYGALEGFETTGIVALAIMTVLLAGGAFLKFVLAKRRATQSGAPLRSIFAGVVAGIIGFFVIPVVGFLIGGVLGILVVERHRLNDWGRAWISTKEVIIGFGIGVALELVAGMLMIAVWAAWVLWG